ncbi:tRNA methyltransferase [Flammula alnicola]|nr:tRNA methyltransferase [Flammula alnicola]
MQRASKFLTGYDCTQKILRISCYPPTKLSKPVQEFNRDTSIACIRVWSEELNRGRRSVGENHRKEGQPKKGTEKDERHVLIHSAPCKSDRRRLFTVEDLRNVIEPKPKEYRPYKFVLLEALSATGLRSIRYAKEIPLIKRVIANDLSPGAVEAMKRNIAINGLGAVDAPSESSATEVPEQKVNSLMYSHREEKKRVDVVDLTRLLCVTCTDLSVLATTNYPEKCFSNYGGIPVKAEYCHESALRLVLHTLSTSASRYGRFIEPLLSLSIDFYVRVFVRVQTSPIEVKKSLTKNSTFYICTTLVTKTSESGQTNYIFKTQAGPPVSDKCPECESNLHVLAHVEESQEHYGTSSRMKGMLTVAKEELQVPFYFTPSKVASFFHCETPSLDDVASALLNAGHQVSRSHACAGAEANFKRHPRTIGALETVRLVRYQEHPRGWGPGKKATATKQPDLKRKRSTEVLEAPPAKH